MSVYYLNKIFLGLPTHPIQPKIEHYIIFPIWSKGLMEVNIRNMDYNLKSVTDTLNVHVYKQ